MSAAAMIAALALGGCSSDDGDDGATSTIGETLDGTQTETASAGSSSDSMASSSTATTDDSMSSTATITGDEPTVTTAQPPYGVPDSTGTTGSDTETDTDTSTGLPRDLDE